MTPAAVHLASVQQTARNAAKDQSSSPTTGDSFASLLQQASQTDDSADATRTATSAPLPIKKPADIKSSRAPDFRPQDDAKPVATSSTDTVKPASSAAASATAATDPTTPATPAVDPTNPAALALAAAEIAQGAAASTAPNAAAAAASSAATANATGADGKPATPPADPTLTDATQAALAGQIATPPAPAAPPASSRATAALPPYPVPNAAQSSAVQTATLTPNAPPPPALPPAEATPAAPVDNGLASALTLTPPKSSTDQAIDDTTSNTLNPVSATGDTGTATSLIGGLATAANDAVQDAGQPPAGQNDASQSTAAPPPAMQVAVAVLRGVDMAAGSQGFTMQLRPERLGTVDVQLEVDSKGRATATFQTDKPETLKLLQQDSQHLLKALNDAGVNADASSLSFSLKDAGSNGSFAEAQERRGSNGQNGGRNGAQNTAQTADETPAWRPSGGNRLYDIHA